MTSLDNDFLDRLADHERRIKDLELSVQQLLSVDSGGGGGGTTGNIDGGLSSSTYTEFIDGGLYNSSYSGTTPINGGTP